MSFFQNLSFFQKLSFYQILSFFQIIELCFEILSYSWTISFIPKIELLNRINKKFELESGSWAFSLQSNSRIFKICAISSRNRIKSHQNSQTFNTKYCHIPCFSLKKLLFLLRPKSANFSSACVLFFFLCFFSQEFDSINISNKRNKRQKKISILTNIISSLTLSNDTKKQHNLPLLLSTNFYLSSFLLRLFSLGATNDADEMEKHISEN